MKKLTLTLLLVLLLGGCANIHATKTTAPDGMVTLEISYFRFGNQQIDGFLIDPDTGEILFEGQKSQNEGLVYSAAKGAAAGVSGR